MSNDSEEWLNAISPSGTLSALTGVGASNAAKAAEAAQLAASQKALDTLISDLAPFKELGTSQIDSVMDLTSGADAQNRYLFDNPSLNLQRSLASGMLSSNPVLGDKVLSEGVQEGLSNRFLGLGQDLIDQQLNRQLPLLNFGQASAAQTGTGGADLLTGMGNARAASGIAQANAQQQGASNAVSLIGTVIGFSDPALKENIEKVGTYNGLGVYTWTWSNDASGLGLVGVGRGHMANEVKEMHPELVVDVDGYDAVFYGVKGKTMESSNGY